MRAPSKFAAVTGLYNVRRDTVDGRGIDRYLGWLNRTVQLPLPFIVFLDPAIEPERVVLKPGDRLVRLPKDELRSYSWLPRVEEICRASTRIKTRRDIAFHLPEYAARGGARSRSRGADLAGCRPAAVFRRRLSGGNDSRPRLPARPRRRRARRPDHAPARAGDAAPR
jgi:hypothetical protein